MTFLVFLSLLLNVIILIVLITKRPSFPANQIRKELAELLYNMKITNIDLTLKAVDRNLEKITHKLFDIKLYHVAGVHIETRKNYIIENCVIREEVKLIPEPNNPVSSNAIKVTHNGNLIGYIPEYLTDEVHEIIEKGFYASINKIDLGHRFELVIEVSPL